MQTNEPMRQEVDAWPGATLLEFGASWCGHCQAAQSYIGEVTKARPDLRHVKIEDGKGQPLGRSFRVKLWPTLIYLVDGEERGRVVRPVRTADIEAMFTEAGR